MFQKFPSWHAVLVAMVIIQERGREKKKESERLRWKSRKENWDQNQAWCVWHPVKSHTLSEPNHMFCMCWPAAYNQPISQNIQTTVLIGSETPLLHPYWLAHSKTTIWLAQNDTNLLYGKDQRVGVNWTRMSVGLQTLSESPYSTELLHSCLLDLVYFLDFESHRFYL